MDVIGYDPFLSVDAALRLSRSVKLAKTQEELLGRSDFLTLHLPQTAKTEGMINRNVLAAVKPGTILLNFARGGLIDDDAVIEALGSGQLGRYVTDFPNDRIIANPKVIAMPHLGASTLEAEENCARMAAARLKEYLISGTIKNSVNFPDCEYPLGEGWRIAIINRNAVSYTHLRAHETD